MIPNRGTRWLTYRYLPAGIFDSGDVNPTTGAQVRRSVQTIWLSEPHPESERAADWGILFTTEASYNSSASVLQAATAGNKRGYSKKALTV